MKREIGTEKDRSPLPSVHEKPTVRKLVFNHIFIIITISFWFFYVTSTIFNYWTFDVHTFRRTVEMVVYLSIVTMLNFSALMYLISRGGAFERFRKHCRVPRELLDAHFAEQQPSITVLVPSYDEETSVVRKTLLSAALQEYPDMRIVLLLDDKPNQTKKDAREKLAATKALAEEIMEFLKEPRKHFSAALTTFESNYHSWETISGSALAELSEEYKRAAEWLHQAAEAEVCEDHVDDFFIDQVYKELAEELLVVSKALEKAVEQDSQLLYQRIHQLYQRLTWIFSAEVSYFQRKEFVSLSHEANKAMNLNSYIGLMGGEYKISHIPAGKVLLRTTGKEGADLTVPDSEFLLTLDADSILLREYCLRLVYLLQQPENQKVAVTQTPYSSFRGTPTRIERIAGATTDIQHILHQGTTYFGATFWVGANAVIRKKALEDIAESESVNGFEIHRYIQDRTVIEDTESSIDLEKHGWQLENYPERLSYSATPPDFGSLIIQRRRWANGGLLILPKMFATMRQRKKDGTPIKWMEFFLRLNYMASITWASFSLILLLTYPFDKKLSSILLLVSAVPYFAAMSSDLKYSRYKRSDVFRIYGFNLILLVVNLAGVLKSIQQALTGHKIPFARTPKVNNRTGSQTLYLLAPIGIMLFSAFTGYHSYLKENWGNVMFAVLNAVTTLWAFVAYIGVGHFLIDIGHNFISWLFVEVKSEEVVTETGQEEADWESVLYYGSTSGRIPLGVRVQHEKETGISKPMYTERAS